MIYKIHLLKGVDSIEFGMIFHEVRKHIGGEFRSYNIGAGLEMFKDNFPVDYYEDKGIFCFYDKSGHLEAMEFISPSRPTLEGVDVLSLTMGQAILLFKRLDPELEANADEATSYRFSVGFGPANSDEGDDALLNGFLAGRPGYYDSVR